MMAKTTNPLTLQIFLTQDWCNPVEAAAEAQMDPNTMRRLIDEGLLRAVDMAGPNAQRPRWKINEAIWLEFAESRAAKRPQPQQPKKKTSPVVIERLV